MVDEFEAGETGDPQPAQARRPGIDSAPTIVPGTVLGDRYRIADVIGRGAIAVVYRGFDELLARSVAVKVFYPGIADTNSVARERTEMQIQANLQNPHLVTLYDAKFAAQPALSSDPAPSTGPATTLTYVVMELVAGGTLADRIGPTGLAPADVARVGAAAAAGLAAVHQFGMVHRDIRPANILLSSSGEVKLSDFGFAQELEVERVNTAAAAGADGSTAYLSPEQARGGAVGPPTDVYALGLVLLEALTGRREYPGQAVESAVARLHRQPVVPDTLPGTWPTLLRAMTRADPARRPTAAQVEAALKTVDAARRPVPATAPPPPPVNQDKATSSVGRVVGVVLLVLVATAGLIVGTVAVIRNNEGNTSTSTIVVSRTVAPTSLVTTTERTTETSREVIAPTLPTLPSIEPPTVPSRDQRTPTTPTLPTPTVPTLSAAGQGGNQATDTTDTTQGSTP